MSDQHSEGPPGVSTMSLATRAERINRLESIIVRKCIVNYIINELIYDSKQNIFGFVGYNKGFEDATWDYIGHFFSLFSDILEATLLK